jgi:hypothetical protein
MEAYMKKQMFCVLFIYALLMTGCASIKVYDSKVPLEKSCLLEIDSSLAVTHFDGEEVKWSIPFSSRNYKVQIPEGDHNFIVNYYAVESFTWKDTAYGPQVSSQTYSYVNDLEYYYTFEAGETYIMKSEVWGGIVRINISKKTQE